MLIDRWLGDAVVVEYVGGRRLEEGALAKVAAGEEADASAPSVKVGVFVLENYNQFGIEVRPRDVSEPHLLPWGAVLAIDVAEGEKPPRPRQGEPARERLGEEGGTDELQEEVSPPRDRRELMDLLNDARTPQEIASARAAADGWLATHPSDGDVRAARERLEARRQEDEELEEGSPT